MTDTATDAAGPAAGPDAEALLDVRDLDVSYALVRALFGVSFTVGHRQMVALLGPNGAGKSTIARAVSGLVPSTAGRIVLDGDDITRWSPHRIRQAGFRPLALGAILWVTVALTSLALQALTGTW